MLLTITTFTPTHLDGQVCSGAASGAGTGGRKTHRGGAETTAEPQGHATKEEVLKSLLAAAGTTDLCPPPLPTL